MLTLSDPIERVAGRPLLVGLSGGLDSTVLLHLLSRLDRPGLRALHVDHGLHADAGRWATHCTATCRTLGIPLTIARAQVDADSSFGPEGAARAARYAAFEAELREEEVLVLAHHRDDQAETFLLRALRGSGPDGLGAMRPWRRFGRGWLWRPLLDTPRADLVTHARQQQLEWIEDPSNIDQAFDRNFLRHRVLPLLHARWPNADAAFARSAALSRDAAVLLDEDDRRALESVRSRSANGLEVSALCELLPQRRARVLRRWIEMLGLPPLPARGVATVESTLLRAASDSVGEFAWAGAVIHRWRSLLHAGWHQAPLPANFRTQWDGRAALPLPGGAQLKLQGCGGFDAPMQVGARQGGERIRLAGRSHSHALKHVLQDLGVPPWDRVRLPLLYGAHGDVLAAGDRVYSGAFAAWLHAREARLAWSAD